MPHSEVCSKCHEPLNVHEHQTVIVSSEDEFYSYVNQQADYEYTWSIIDQGIIQIKLFWCLLPDSKDLG